MLFFKLQSPAAATAHLIGCLIIEAISDFAIVTSPPSLKEKVTKFPFIRTSLAVMLRPEMNLIKYLNLLGAAGFTALCFTSFDRLMGPRFCTTDGVGFGATFTVCCDLVAAGVGTSVFGIS